MIDGLADSNDNMIDTRELTVVKINSVTNKICYRIAKIELVSAFTTDGFWIRVKAMEDNIGFVEINGRNYKVK